MWLGQFHELTSLQAVFRPGALDQCDRTPQRHSVACTRCVEELRGIRTTFHAPLVAFAVVVHPSAVAHIAQQAEGVLAPGDIGEVKHTVIR